jgi:hypothetical protein
MKTDITIGRTFADRCLELLRDQKLDNTTASMAKYVFCSIVLPSLSCL